MSAFKTWITSLTSKATPIDADETYLRDSVTGNSYKLTWANIKATLKTYLDTLYLSVTGGTLAGGVVTASTPVLSVTQTWNNAAVAFTGIAANITSTASAVGSKLLDISVAGVSQLKFSALNSAGVWVLSVPSSTGGGYAMEGRFRLSAITGNTGGCLNVGSSTAAPAAVWGSAGGVNVLKIPDAAAFGFGLGGNDASLDIALIRDAAGVLAQRNGTAAQTKRLYGTYTDASNYRRVAIAMTTAGVASIAPEGAGTGASGNVLHISGLPTANPGPGILWNDAGTVKVGT